MCSFGCCLEGDGEGGKRGTGGENPEGEGGLQPGCPPFPGLSPQDTGRTLLRMWSTQSIKKRKKKNTPKLDPHKSKRSPNADPAGKPVFIIPAKGQFVNNFFRFYAKSSGIREKKPGFVDYFAQNATNSPDLNRVFHSVVESRVEKPLLFHCKILCPALRFLFLVHLLSQKFSTGLWKTMLRILPLSTARCSEKYIPLPIQSGKRKTLPGMGSAGADEVTRTLTDESTRA